MKTKETHFNTFTTLEFNEKTAQNESVFVIAFDLAEEKIKNGHTVIGGERFSKLLSKTEAIELAIKLLNFAK